MRYAVPLAAALLATASDVQALSLLYPVEVQNKTNREVVVEFSVYPSEEAARTPAMVERERQRGFVEILKVGAGETKRFHTLENWVLWCRLEPKSNLPCGLFHNRTSPTNIVFE